MSAIIDFRQNHPVIATVASTALSGGVGALAGFIVSKIAKTSPLLALILGVEFAVSRLFSSIMDIAAKQNNMDKYKVTLINAVVGTVISAAGLAAVVALGIFGTPYLIGMAVFNGVWLLGNVVYAGYQYHQQYGEPAAV